MCVFSIRIPVFLGITGVPPVILGITPVIPGLIADLTDVIYEYCGGYELSMVAKDWNIYCLRKMKTIEDTENSIEQNCREHNILEIVRNYKKLDEDCVMLYACKYDINLLISIIERLGNARYHYGLYGACWGGHIHLVKYMKERITNSYNYIYNVRDHRDIAKYTLAGPEHNDGLFAACYGGHIDIVKYMIELGADNYDSGLYAACLCGHKHIIKFMIEIGANDYNFGLNGACRSGKIDVVKYLIKLGANDYNQGLVGACVYKHVDIIKYMIELGANRCDRCEKSMQEHLNE
jgi:hypothetical protein